VLWHESSVMYSLRRKFVPCGALGRESSQQPVEVGSGELPLERRCHRFVNGLEGKNALPEIVKRDRVGRCQHFALQDRKVNLDLIDPTGVDGQVHGDKVAMRRLHTPDRSQAAVGTAVVDHPENTAGGTIGLLGHDFFDQAVEGRDAGGRLEMAEELGPVHVPSSDVGESTAAVVFMLHKHRMVGVGGDRAMAADTGLDRSFLVGRDHELVSLQLPAFELAGIEVEGPAGLGCEVGVTGEDPAAVGPGLDRVFGQPAPDRGSGDLGHQATLDDLRLDVRDVQPGERQTELGRQLTGDRLDGDDDLWGGKPGPARFDPGR